MQTDITIVALQLNSTIGALKNNAEKIKQAAWHAFETYHATLIITPELALTGYPAEDLLYRNDFLDDVEHTLVHLCSQLPPTDIIIGLPYLSDNGLLYNSLVYIRNQHILTRYHKQILPNDGVFDDKRYFTQGHMTQVVDCQGIRVGLAICEDFWHEPVARHAKAQGAELLISLNASPFDHDKIERREHMMIARVLDTGLPLIYTACVGGQDELVYDGHSFALQHDGTLVTRAPGFVEAALVIHVQRQGNALQLHSLTPPSAVTDPEAMMYQALVLALRDYVQKNHFQHVLLGLSGGIDSALVACIAVDALGPDKVHGILLPSRYTATMSLDDAYALAASLHIRTENLTIEPLIHCFTDTLASQFQGRPADKTEENLQARCRGVLLMALSNKSGALLLSTSNKSETAVGYATLYGDMAGGFSPIKDVYKTQVYRLAAYRNRLAPVIPLRTIERAPSAELSPDQKDSDSLPDYAILDDLLYRFIEKRQSKTALIAAGFLPETVQHIVTLIARNEYKRRQAAIGPRVTPCAFGKERRMPITQQFF